MQKWIIPLTILFLPWILLIVSRIFSIHNDSFETPRNLNFSSNIDPTTRVIFFLDDTVDLDSRDPFVQVYARTSLLANYSIKCNADIRVCTSDLCLQTFTIPAGTQQTQGLINENSRFIFKQTKQQEKEQVELTEYYNNFASLPYRVSVSARFPLEKDLTLADFQSAIKQGQMNIWFINPSLETKTKFQIQVNGTFTPWSTNQTIPDVSCGSCDMIQIMPRK